MAASPSRHARVMRMYFSSAAVPAASSTAAPGASPPLAPDLQKSSASPPVAASPSEKEHPDVQKFASELALLGVPQALPAEAKEALLRLRSILEIELCRGAAGKVEVESSEKPACLQNSPLASRGTPSRKRQRLSECFVEKEPGKALSSDILARCPTPSRASTGRSSCPGSGCREQKREAVQKENLQEHSKQSQVATSTSEPETLENNVSELVKEPPKETAVLELRGRTSLEHEEDATTPAPSGHESEQRSAVTDTELSKAAKTCPGGHSLRAAKAPDSDWECSACGQEVQKGTILYGCRNCNYDECESCVAKAFSAPRAAEVEQRDVAEHTEVAKMTPQNESVAKLSISQLKGLLNAAGVSYVGAVDKDDLVRLVRRLVRQGETHAATKAANEAAAKAAHAAVASPAVETAAATADPEACVPTAEEVPAEVSSAAETCALCCETILPAVAHRLSCSHGLYCSGCMERHAKARLEMGHVDVTCPQCMVPLPEHELSNLLPQEMLDRLQSRSLEKAVSAVADLRHCPTPNCTMRVAVEEGEPAAFQCPTCDRESCLRCGAQPFHKRLTCEEHAKRTKNKRDQKVEDSFQKWMQKTGTKRCPQCSAPVSKQNLGKQGTQYAECHKMVCRSCTTRFCFKCEKVLTATFTCRCSIDAHGFCDPLTGQRLDHLDPAAAKPVAKRKRK